MERKAEFCPLFFIGWDQKSLDAVKCMEERCMWWDAEQVACAVKSIAVETRNRVVASQDIQQEIAAAIETMLRERA